MKKFTLMMAVIVALLGFTGCGSTGPKLTTPSGETYYIPKDGDNFKVFGLKSNVATKEKAKTLKNYYSKEEALKAQLTVAARYAKTKGYNYFVLTNSNVSNLNGFPINKYSDLVRYLTLSERKSSFSTDGNADIYDGIIIGGNYTEMYVRFRPISNEIANSGAISVWKVSDFI